jgi:hypothetical protein
MFLRRPDAGADADADVAGGVPDADADENADVVADAYALSDDDADGPPDAHAVSDDGADAYALKARARTSRGRLCREGAPVPLHPGPFSTQE